MEEFKCQRCGYEATTKGSLKRHLLSKTACEPRVSNADRNELIALLAREVTGNTTMCEGCNKQASTANLARHRAVCKGVPSSSNGTSEHSEPTTNLPKKRKLLKMFRMMVWKHYIGFQTAESSCWCCKSYITAFDFNCGHVVSRANGGKDCITNLRPICYMCKSSLGSMNMTEFALKHCSVTIN